jgi:hypothetical protein
MRTGKKIPLDAETNEPHNCPVRRSQQSRLPQLQQQPSQQQEYQERRYHQQSLTNARKSILTRFERQMDSIRQRNGVPHHVNR